MYLFIVVCCVLMFCFVFVCFIIVVVLFVCFLLFFVCLCVSSSVFFFLSSRDVNFHERHLMCVLFIRV